MITLISVKASSRACLAAHRVIISAHVMDGVVFLRRLLEVVVTGERQSISNEGQFYGGLECQGISFFL